MPVTTRVDWVPSGAGVTGGVLLGRGLVGQVSGLVTRAVGRVPPGPARDQLVQVATRLRRPLRIAVGGQVSAGKSTLVNALLGQRLAATGAGETTRLFALYEFDENESVEIHLTDGRVRRRSLTVHGEVPEDLGVPPGEVEVLRVRLSTAGALSKVTIMDTPGLGSLRETAAGLTERRLFGMGESIVADADALLFLLQTGGRAREAAYLDSFRELTAGSTSCSLNAIGVLSRCDTDDVEDPLGAYGRMAARLCREPALQFQLATVVPVVGLLAQTVQAGLLGEDHLAALRRLVDQPPQLLAASAEQFRKVASGQGLSEGMAEQLLDLLGLFGLGRAVRALREGVSDLPGLYRVLLDGSGFDRLLEQIDRLFLPRADVLKADQALGAVLRLAYQLPDPLGEALRAEVEDLRLSPSMHALQELWAVRQCSSGPDGTPPVVLPDWLHEELVRLTGPGGVRQRLGLPPEACPEQVRRTAAELAERVHVFADAPTTWLAQRQVANVLRLSYAALWQQAAAPDAEPVNNDGLVGQ